MFNRFFPSGIKVLLAMCCLAASSLASAVTVDEIIKRGKLLVAIDTNNPPWGMLDASMQPDGGAMFVAPDPNEPPGPLRCGSLSGPIEGLQIIQPDPAS